MNINEIARRLESNGIDFNGCSEREIKAIESKIGARLPETYREFLFLMGKDAGTFMRGSSVFYDEILDLNEASARLLEENGFSTLPEASFVFWMHQGYQFAFFKLDEGDNPPIYFYYEGKTKNEFEKREVSFTNFLEKQLLFSGL